MTCWEKTVGFAGPHSTPYRGSKNEQNFLQFSFPVTHEILGTNGDTGVVHWQASQARVTQN